MIYCNIPNRLRQQNHIEYISTLLTWFIYWTYIVSIDYSHSTRYVAGQRQQ